MRLGLGWSAGRSSCTHSHATHPALTSLPHPHPRPPTPPPHPSSHPYSKQELGDLDGVTCFCELAMPLCARLCERLGLATNSPEAVDAARDKHATRALMGAAGLPTPRNMLVESPAALPKAAAHVGFPAVIKPISGAASLGVLRVNSEPELQEAYDKVGEVVGRWVGGWFGRSALRCLPVPPLVLHSVCSLVCCLGGRSSGVRAGSRLVGLCPSAAVSSRIAGHP